jgi:hypothetical protein
MRNFILVALGVAAIATGANAAVLRSEAKLAGPAPKAAKVVIDGRVWTCDGATCTAAGEGRSQSIARECWRAARKLGPFTAYSRDGVALDEAALKACNSQ